MVIFVNNKNEIKDVGSTTNVELTGKVIDDADNPFAGWSTAKICCYKATVLFGKVTMMTPYVDSRLLEHIDQLGQSTELNASDISDNRDGLEETFENSLVNTDDISTLREGLEEVYEMLLESEVEE